MKNYIKIIAFVSAIAIFGSGCTKNFADVNTDPNRIDAISPGTLLNPIVYNVANYYMLRSDDITFNLMQVALPFPSASGGVHRYDLSDNIGNGTWNTSYLWLKNIKEMQAAAIKAEDPNYQAISMVLNAWIYANLTDCFGDIPMTEASRAEEGFIHPAFNTQKEVYTKLIADLDSANNLFNTTKTMLYGTEILYGNGVAKWKKFANSLQLRLLLRVSGKTEMGALAKLRAIIDNPTKYPVFTANADGAVLQLSGITPLGGTWARPVDFTSYRSMGQFFLDTLNAYNDPRRAKFATNARDLNNVSIGYKGIPSGYNGSQSFNYTPSNVNVAMVTAPMMCPIMYYNEVEFIKAEVEYLSGNMAASKTAYEKAVKAAIEQWGAVMPADYFTNTNTVFNNTLSRIHMQKYYGLFFCDFQSWAECRRTGFPVLPKGDAMGNNKVLPSRLEYPIPVRTTNATNYKKVSEAIGGDDINTKVWWNK